MDPKLTAHYSAPQRPPVFLTERPALRVKRPLWPLSIYATLAGLIALGCAINSLVHHIH